VNRGLQRTLAAFVVAGVIIGGWLGAPLLAAPGGPPVGTGPSASAAGSDVSTTPPMTETAGPSHPGASAGPSVRSSPAPSGIGDPGATSGPTPGVGAPNPPGPVRRGFATATPLLRAALDRRLEALRAKAGIPGISATILFPDGSIWQGAAGLADVATKRRVSTGTVFPAASISKTFTAALILALVADGRVGLDKPVTSYLPTLAIDRTITVRQLLDHRSGLSDFYFHKAIDKALLSKPSLVWTAARSLTFVGKPYFKAGTGWHYSNTNYLILGLLAEAVGGDTVAHQLHTRFLGPLGLDHTSYQLVEAPLGPVAHGYRFTGANLKLPGIDLSDGTTVVPFTSVVTAAGAAGSIATTSGDLARWGRALYQGTALDRASRIAMVADALQVAPYQPAISYGLGVQVVQIDGHVTLGHSGRFLGARAAVRWVADEGITIAVMTNQSRSDPNVIVADLLRHALLPQADCVVCPVLP
jgi:D-alanyl-D-alanine carboxypeptidase